MYWLITLGCESHRGRQYVPYPAGVVVRPEHAYAISCVALDQSLEEFALRLLCGKPHTQHR